MNKLEPNKQRADNAIILIWIVLALEIVSLIFGCYNYILLRTIADGGQISMEKAEASDMINGIISIIYLIAWIISTVMFIKWFRRAYSNLQKVTSTLYSENWAIYCWFIPILALYRPYQIMKELYCKTKELLIEKGILNNETSLPPHSLGQWWALFIITIIIGNRAALFSLRAETTDQLITSSLIDMSLSILDILLALITIKIIKDYSKMESSLYMVNENYGSAISDYNEAIMLNPNLAEAYNNRGNAYYSKGDHDKAISDYSEAIRLNPNDVEVYISRGYVYEKKGDIDKAIADYESALRINPNHSNAQKTLENLKRMKQKQ
jgi:tetratricopeptide (TPR) repeat protein